VVEWCIDEVKGRVPVIAGAGSNSTKEAIELSASPSLALALAISVTAVIVIGVFPSDLLNFARASIAGIM